MKVVISDVIYRLEVISVVAWMEDLGNKEVTSCSHVRRKPYTCTMNSLFFVGTIILFFSSEKDILVKALDL